ncbi:helix-turn-helix domain-containing protein [bacterium]|nr:helix-turn-helix domain-containing protein [bacterium]
MQLGDRIRELRDQKGETLKDISKNTGISISYLSDLERNITRPSLQTLESLASHFDYSLIDLLKGVEFAGEQTNKALPPGLSELLNDDEFKDEITDDWVQLLQKIELRGKRPTTKREWTTLYLNLKQILDTP